MGIVAVEQTGEGVANLFDNTSRALDGLPLVLGSAPVTPGPTPDGTTSKSLYDAGEINDGVYVLDPDGDGIGFQAYCNMTENGGGWTLAAVGVSDTTESDLLETQSAVGAPLDPDQADDAKLSDADWAALGSVTWFQINELPAYYVQYTESAWTLQNYDPDGITDEPACADNPDMLNATQGRDSHVADCYNTLTGLDSVGIFVSPDLFIGASALNWQGGLAWVR